MRTPSLPLLRETPNNCPVRPERSEAKSKDALFHRKGAPQAGIDQRFLRLALHLILFLLLHLILLQPAHSQDGPGNPSAQAPDDGPGLAAPTTRDAPYDPLEPFNDKVFEFNRGFDRVLLKPVAQGYAAVVPPPVQTGIHNAVENLDVVRKVVNNVLQGKPARAGREAARFVVNSTLGVAGLFDVAEKMGLASADQDMGITLGLHGLGHGAYLVLPLLPPTTVRDGAGTVADSLMNPLRWLAPYYVSLSIRGVGLVNTRARNMEAFEQLERSIDPYGAARNAYLQIRRRKLEQARSSAPGVPQPERP